jgi:two-component system chemotaxis response regulator CheY
MSSEPKPKRAAAAPPLIVYADDDAETRELVRVIFEQAGFRVELAESGEGLIDTVNRLCESDDCPDAIVSDVNFFKAAPRSGVKLTGIGAAFQINLKFPNLPILFLTGYADRGTRANARAASNSEVLSKPFVPAELVGRVRDALRFRVKAWQGVERRRNSINSTGNARRRTDRRIELPRVVSEAMSFAGGSEEGRSAAK